ncbi:MAG TPA: response regulator [Terriglobales bacterium]|nr:response regulator [Terriglobales bacterium]
MTTSFLPLPLSSPIADPIKRRRVLLVDTSSATRVLRADAMRKLGMDVDSACDISEARSWWRADLYNLVLVNMENEPEARDKFCEEVRSATPPQQLMFLVGKPGYFADLPNSINSSLPEISSATENPAAQSININDDSSVRWGIMEASRRISQVRSVSVAHTMAMRNRPTPPRDLEVRDPRRADISRLAFGLRKEELL